MLETLHLADALKGYTFDQDKLLTPEETVRRVRDRLAHLDLKLLQETMRIDSGRLDIPVYLSLLDVDARRVVPTHKQMGKGATPVQAEASALMELVERFSFFAYIEEGPLDLGTPRDLKGQALPFSYLARSLFDETPEAAAAAPLYEDWPLYFVPATNLNRGEAVYLPIHWFYLIEEYNGPAAGNCLEEAILQGLCEVVERHVGSIISHDRLHTPIIDPDSVTDPVARELLEKFKQNGIVLHLRDFSMDTGIPTVAALAYDPSTFPQDSEIVFAAGTTTDPTKSLVRALTEVAQLAGDFNRRTSYRPTLPKYETLEDAAYLMAPGPLTKNLDSLPNLSRPNLKDEIDLCLAALSRLDLEVLVVNTTHPSLNLPTVYVLVPGTHFLDRTRNTTAIFHLAKVAALAELDAAFPKRFDVNFFLGLALENQDRAQEALVHFRQALEFDPPAHEIPSIYVHLGACQKDLGNFQEAAAAFTQAVALSPDLKEAHHLLGFCCFKLEEFQQAVECFEKVIDLDPGSAIDYANLGINLQRLGHPKEAAYVLKQALELDPTLDFAAKMLADLEG